MNEEERQRAVTRWATNRRKIARQDRRYTEKTGAAMWVRCSDLQSAARRPAIIPILGQEYLHLSPLPTDIICE